MGETELVALLNFTLLTHGVVERYVICNWHFLVYNVYDPVNPEIFARILFSRIALKDTFAT